jgi:putative hydrolase of HD superfamily
MILIQAYLGQEIFDLWCEYEDGATAEGKVVKQLDKLEMILQASEYEKCKSSVNIEYDLHETKLKLNASALFL